MAKRILIVATVVKKHIMQFHIPTIKMLNDMGWEVDVAARNDYENQEELNIPYIDAYYDIPISRNPLNKKNIDAYKKLKQLIDSGRYDIVHCHTPMGGFLTRLAGKDARKKGTKILYTAHGFHFYKKAPFVNWLLYYPAERYCSKYTDVLITICTEDYELAKKKMYAKYIEYTPGIGIDIDRIKNEIREPHDISKKVILSVGELNRNKNHKVVIKAIKNLNDKNIEYLIVGEGKLKERLQKLIDDIGLSSQVKLLGYRTDVAKIYKKADLFVHPSHREGMPVAVMEAMASELPIIASDVRGSRELLPKGVLFDPNSVTEVENKIKTALTIDNKNQIEESSKKIEQYSKANVLKILKAIYEREVS